MTTPRRVLAFSQDEFLLKTADKHFAQAGLELCAVRDPSAVMAQVASFKPNLLLVDREGPGTGGSSAADLLGGTGIPMVFALGNTSGRDLIHALQARAVDVLQLPFNEQQAARIIELLNELDARPPHESLTREEQLTRNLMDLARRHKLHGTLAVNQGTPFEGRVVFKEGALVRAVYGPLAGIDAVREILQLEDGVYELDTSLERPPQRVAHSAIEMEPGQAAAVGLADQADIRPRLLVVDDQPEMLTLSSKHLTRAGFEVQTAQDGAVAVQAVLTSPFDLIIADLNMPHMDGWEMLKTLKADHRTSEIPVIFLSAHDDLLETLRAARSGAHDYLAKTGRWDVIVSAALKAITPRLEMLFHLLVNEPVEVRTQVVGLHWLLRTLAKLRVTGVLELKDDYGTYRLDVQLGNPVAAQARVQQRSVGGLPAFVRMRVAAGAKGTFSVGPVSVGGAGALSLSMEELITRACEGLNSVEAKAAEQRLASAARFEVDQELYSLFCRIAPPKKVAFAQSVCERKFPIADLANALQLTREQALEWYNELLRRGVIKPEARFELTTTPMPRGP